MQLTIKQFRNPILSEMDSPAGTNFATGDGTIVHDDHTPTKICIPIQGGINPSTSKKYSISGTEVHSATDQDYVQYNDMDYLYFNFQGRACFQVSDSNS
ncbi:hypothetical protein GS597_11660 [Synechococcales cyanobacterium C]|uniref:Uncharacterized protein n=1 Tax=Petrachloros mirabilis ULC683 TaxID=2781853 RepID=A0A8K2A038_9CYAN|nr:hypothetical protein [Petrachloros mirabilis]NCJ07148.1 hypothetical protein [Petrachloros mirabilis ULC683]